MTNELHQLIEYVKTNIPKAEILKVSHTQTVFKQESETACSSHSIAEGIIVIIPTPD